jgi:hypothetical protein
MSLVADVDTQSTEVVWVGASHPDEGAPRIVSYTPVKEDRFGFGLWTVGRMGQDPFGDAVREPLDPMLAAHELARLGDFKPPRTEDPSGVWTSATGRMRDYLILKEKAAAWRADPQVQEAMAASIVDRLRIPMPAPAEPVADLMTEELDVAVTARRGFHYERPDQLAFDDLPGVRG